MGVQERENLTGNGEFLRRVDRWSRDFEKGGKFGKILIMMRGWTLLEVE